MKITQDDIYYLVSKETNIPQKQVEFVINSFWYSIRQKITNPLESQLGIRISKFIRFELTHSSVQRKLRQNISSEKKIFYNKLKQLINARQEKNKPKHK